MRNVTTPSVRTLFFLLKNDSTSTAIKYSLTLKSPITTAADDNFLVFIIIIIIFQRKQCLADDSHEIAGLVFSEK